MCLVFLFRYFHNRKTVILITSSKKILLLKVDKKGNYLIIVWNGFWATILVLFCELQETTHAHCSSIMHYVWSIMQCNTQLCLIDVLFCIMIVQLCLLTRPLCILYLQLFNMPNKAIAAPPRRIISLT